jgi:hypothetical protein
MVDEINLNSWEEFQEEVKNLGKSMRETERRPPLFRGQSNSNWHLDTTLERWVAPRRQDVPGMSFVDYYNIISSARAEIETLTGTIWTTPPQYRIITKEMDQMGLNYDVISQELAYGRIPGYEYIAYLRHHRFPSPLLDWTRSPYIAAYFAFSEVVNSEAVSIYMLSEGSFRSGFPGAATIVRLGPDVKIHRRHVLQQSEYTMALFNKPEEGYFFVRHENVLEVSKLSKNREPDFELKKLIIPSRERDKVLALLDAHNLNAFSLFGSEESLMQTIAIRRLHL